MGWLNLKIYKQNIEVTTEENEFFLNLINNNLTLNEKMKQLKQSYKDLILEPTAMDFLVKKALTNMGFDCRFARVGDNNERFDLLIKKENQIGIVEIEIPSTEMLETPRNLLDDIAVSINRRGMKLKNIQPIVICWTYPNKRTDYWNVVNDINNVLGIKIKTISVMALLCNLWLKQEDFILNDNYFLHRDNLELIELKEKLENEGVDLSIFNGFFNNIK